MEKTGTLKLDNPNNEEELPFLPNPNIESKLFNVKTANEWMEEALNMPDPEPLYDCLWYEGQTAFLFGGPGSGKSLLGVQAGYEISKTRPVVYFDFELSQKQFAMRYVKENRTSYHQFPDNFFRIEFARGADYTEDELIDEINTTAKALEAKTMIIDNISWLLTDGEKATAAKSFMKKLDKLKKDEGYSVLILGHTPKRDETRPIQLSDMAGSMALGNFIDGVFAIVKSFRGPDFRYIKQLKVRDTVSTYHYDNVKVMEIEKRSDGFLGLNNIDTSSEKEHLRQPNTNEFEDKKQIVINLHKQGLTYKHIQEQTGLAKGTISKYINQVKDVTEDNEDLPF